jgi:hypothetical protein
MMGRREEEGSTLVPLSTPRQRVQQEAQFGKQWEISVLDTLQCILEDPGDI